MLQKCRQMLFRIVKAKWTWAINSLHKHSPAINLGVRVISEEKNVGAGDRMNFKIDGSGLFGKFPETSEDSLF